MLWSSINWESSWIFQSSFPDLMLDIEIFSIFFGFIKLIDFSFGSVLTLLCRFGDTTSLFSEGNVSALINTLVTADFQWRFYYFVWTLHNWFLSLVKFSESALTKTAPLCSAQLLSGALHRTAWASSWFGNLLPSSRCSHQPCIQLTAVPQQGNGFKAPNTRLSPTSYLASKSCPVVATMEA